MLHTRGGRPRRTRLHDAAPGSPTGVIYDCLVNMALPRHRRPCRSSDRSIVEASGSHSPLRRGRGRRRRARDVSRRLPARALRGDHGPVGVGQVDAHAHPRRPRPADVGHGADRRRRAHGRSTTASSRSCAATQSASSSRPSTCCRCSSAEENILLPLSIAGRKPDREWFDRLVDTVGIRDRLHHRPARALRRPAAARRGRARADLAPVGRVRRRALGQPRLESLRRRAATCCATPSTTSARRS